MTRTRKAKSFTRRAFLQTASVTAIAAIIAAGSMSQKARAAAARVQPLKPDADKRFDAHHMSILTAVADHMIPATDTPGALAAGVPAFIDDLMVTWAKEETRQAFRGALNAIDDAAQSRFNQSYPGLNAENQITVLTAYDAAAFEEDVTDAFEGYRQLKEKMFYGYYRSEVGALEELQHEPVPGAQARNDAPLADIGRAWVER